MAHRYQYEDLRAAAVAPGAAQEAINELGAWFEQFGMSCWNGEYFDADDGLRLFRVYSWDDESDTGDVVGYEFR